MSLSNDIKILERRIDILKDKIEEQSKSYDKIGDKTFALVGFLLAAVSLLAYDIFRINLPDTTIEWILFAIASTCLLVCISLVGYTYRPTKKWPVPIGPGEDATLDKISKYIDALELIHKDYQLCNTQREQVVSKRAKLVNASLYLFVAGAIIIMILKIGG